MTPPSSSRAAIAATIAAVAAVAAGLFVLGSPSHARQHRFDDLRLRDLTRIASNVDAYWKRHDALPDGLDTLRSDGLLDPVPRDPRTNAPYTYHASGERSYRLCAVFALPHDTADARDYVDGEYLGARSWMHGAGESCFDRNAPDKNKQ